MRTVQDAAVEHGPAHARDSSIWPGSAHALGGVASRGRVGRLPTLVVPDGPIPVAYAGGHCYAQVETPERGRGLDQKAVRVGRSKPGFPRWIVVRLTFWRRLSRKVRGLHGRKRVQFDLTDCPHRNWPFEWRKLLMRLSKLASRA